MYTKHHFAVIWLMPKQLSTNIFSPYWVLPSNLFSHKSAGDFCVAQISSFYFAKKKTGAVSAPKRVLYFCKCLAMPNRAWKRFLYI